MGAVAIAPPSGERCADAIGPRKRRRVDDASRLCPRHGYGHSPTGGYGTIGGPGLPGIPGTATEVRGGSASDSAVLVRGAGASSFLAHRLDWAPGPRLGPVGIGLGLSWASFDRARPWAPRPTLGPRGPLYSEPDPAGQRPLGALPRRRLSQRALELSSGKTAGARLGNLKRNDRSRHVPSKRHDHAESLDSRAPTLGSAPSVFWSGLR